MRGYESRRHRQLVKEQPQQKLYNLLLDDQLSKVSEINYEGDDVLKQQRLGAIAVNQLVANFTLLKHEEDFE